MAFKCFFEPWLSFKGILNGLNHSWEPKNCQIGEQ